MHTTPEKKNGEKNEGRRNEARKKEDGLEKGGRELSRERKLREIRTTCCWLSNACLCFCASFYYQAALF